MQIRQIRQIQQHDNAELAELIRKVFREFKIDIPWTVYTDPTTDHLFELFIRSGSVYWVAEENGELLGGCGIFPTTGLPEGCAELVKFYVASAYRGKGVGKSLMEQSILSARELGYTQLYLDSFPELEKAVSMYEKEGFRSIDAPMGSSGHTACTLWMSKEL